MRRRRRKKVPVSERHPLGRPIAANEVWSLDFVFDRVAGGRAIKCLAIVDDATHEAVAVVPDRREAKTGRALARASYYSGLIPAVLISLPQRGRSYLMRSATVRGY